MTIVMLLVLLLGLGADLACVASADDCCDQSQCVLCNQQMLTAQTAAPIDVMLMLLATLPTDVAAPPTPILDRLFPPPRA
jgi:hypothetical protein